MFTIFFEFSGPNQAQFINANASRSNATNLTKGSYTFKLSVQDSNSNEDTSLVYITVTQDNNAPPVAVAGNFTKI